MLLASIIIGAIAPLGEAGIARLMAIESACIPLASEIIRPFSGCLVPVGEMQLGAVGLCRGGGRRWTSSARRPRPSHPE
jgi:membrane protein DedA with SNARE-associated domain